MSASFFKTARTFVPRTVHSAYFLALVLGTSVSADENPPPFGIEFDSPDILEQQEGTAGSACGDLDKDGRIEFVTQEHFAIYDYDEGSINSYRPLPDINGRLDRFGGDIEIGDINGDTWPDIVLTDTSNSGDTGELIWFENPLGNLAGSWIEHSVSTWDGVGTGNQITHAEEEVGDVDGDGRIDIVVRDIRHGFWVHLQNDSGGWHPRVFIATNPREGLDLWNPDGDDDLDILLNGVWYETPDDPLNGSYTQHAIPGMEDWYPAGNTNTEIDDYACKVIAADFNGDGRDDVLISNAEELDGDSPTKPHGIAVYLQPSTGLSDPWTEMIVEPMHFSWHTLQAKDMNRDGQIDIIGAISTVGADTADAESNIWINDGSANFSKVPVATDYGYQGEVGDSDGDGDLDLLLPETFSSGKVRFYDNISTLPASNFEQYMSSFGVSGPDAAEGADFDLDGLTNMIEFVLGTDPTQTTSSDKRPQFTRFSQGAVFSYQRLDDSIPDSPRVEISSDLKTFDTAVDGVDGVLIFEFDDDVAPGIDRVLVYLPNSLAVDGRLFARLYAKATAPSPGFSALYRSFESDFGMEGLRIGQEGDFDGDGVKNGIEFMLGTDPTSHTPASDRPKHEIVPGGYRVTFRRSDQSISGFPRVEISHDLKTFMPVMNGNDGVMVTVTNDGFGPGVDRVEVFLPESLMVDGRLLLRLGFG